MSNKHSTMIAGRASARHFLAAAIFALFRQLAAAFERRQTRRALQDLDDHLLADIGISRGEIERIARTSRLPR